MTVEKAKLQKYSKSQFVTRLCIQQYKVLSKIKAKFKKGKWNHNKAKNNQQLFTAEEKCINSNENILYYSH